MHNLDRADIQHLQKAALTACHRAVMHLAVSRLTLHLFLGYMMGQLACTSSLFVISKSSQVASIPSPQVIPSRKALTGRAWTHGRAVKPVCAVLSLSMHQQPALLIETQNTMLWRECA